MRRRGTVTDIPVILLTLTGLAITVVIAAVILDTVVGATTNAMINQEVLKSAQTALSIYNYGVMFVAIGMFTVSILFAYRIRTSPIFAIPSLLFVAMSVWLSSEVANIYVLFSQANQQVSSVAASFDGINLLFSNLPLVTGVMGFVTLVALYVRRDNLQGEVTA